MLAHGRIQAGDLRGAVDCRIGDGALVHATRGCGAERVR